MICCCSRAAAYPQAAPAQRANAHDGGHERDADLERPMDFDEERDYAGQGPLSDMDMEDDAEIFATLLKHIPSCMSADDIEKLLQDIPGFLHDSCHTRRAAGSRPLSLSLSLSPSLRVPLHTEMLIPIMAYLYMKYDPQFNG